MLRYLLRRVLIAIPVLFGISLVVYLLVNLQPGDPFVGMVGPETTPAEKAELLRRYGYDDPLVVQYLRWLMRALAGDLGYSLQQGRPVTALIGERLGNTGLLAGAALALTLVVALPLGLFVGLRRNGGVDLAVSVLSFVLVSVPAFFLSMLLIKVFAVDLRLLPTAGVTTIGADYHGLAHLRDVALHLVLPASVLALGNIAVLNRYLRASVSELVDQDFIRGLFGRGIPRRRVIAPHILRNAARPLITIVSLEIPALLSSALLTETIFNWPGIGRLSFEAVQGRDYPLLMGIVLFLAVVTLACNLLADVLYALVDPRVRLAP
ncbi:ABC transporter permease [Paenirhodobacter populi]|uniref:ABC transporter permease n=1 Tax=Paenirhodobacter populi TaxID=2306993 RepID=UPI000FE33F8C|nr:ABC transporter permease [Sinirhodobacter populi]RWR05236.1 ABC transporter permease [Sinirhodobacter populi]